MSNRLTANQRLRPNQSLLSANGQFQLTLKNGNLFFSRGVGNPLWANNTSGRWVDYAHMQADGNFVIYGSDRELWSTRTFQRGKYLVLEDDGNLVIYNSSNKVVWTTGSLVR